MRVFTLSCGIVLMSMAPALSQEPSRKSPASPAPGAASDEKAAEVRRAIQRGQARQRVADLRNTRIWQRWGYAVCVGCGPLPSDCRRVYTTPGRVLAGFIAADDDARRTGRRI